MTGAAVRGGGSGLTLNDALRFKASSSAVRRRINSAREGIGMSSRCLILSIRGLYLDGIQHICKATNHDASPLLGCANTPAVTNSFSSLNRRAA